ncbi:MAG: ATP-binding protein [Candidatus Zixiibacteriota bacterium]
MKREEKAKQRSKRAVELLGTAIDVKINELTESNRQLKRKIFDLYTIFEISRNFNSVLHYHTLVDSFLLTSLGQVGASASALYLPIEDGSPVFELAKSKGLLHNQQLKDDIRLGDYIIDQLSHSAKPMPVQEFIGLLGGNGEYRTLNVFSSGILLPLIIKSELKGLLLVSNKVTGELFAADDIEFLSILANQFVVALENARLYESEKNALEELRITQKQLVLTERQAAIGELSAKIAHEVNNPLSIISNYLHLAGRNIEKPDAALNHLDVVKQELGRIARIVRQLLDFHRPQVLEKRAVDVGQIVEDILGLIYWQLADNKIIVDKHIAPNLPRILGAPEQLKQVMLNMVINAKDFMPEGGTLTIKAYGQDGWLKISFADTGPGIPQENLSRIFEPFFTTKEGSKGTGLGLSVCFGIIKEHNGRIAAANAPGKGAVFEISIPALSADKKV